MQVNVQSTSALMTSGESKQLQRHFKESWAYNIAAYILANLLASSWSRDQSWSAWLLHEHFTTVAAIKTCGV